MQPQNMLLTEKLSHLCAMLEDAHEGYQMAADHTRDEKFELTFDRLSYERLHFIRDIKKLVSTLGEKISTGDGFLNLLHRSWQEMRFKIKSGNIDTIRCCCVLGEQVVANYYNSIINDPEMPPVIKDLLSVQLKNIEEAIKAFSQQELATEVRLTGLSSSAASVTQSSRNKLAFIVSLLNRVANDFEMIADEMEDKNLRNAFLSLSEEDKQFAEELNDQMKHFGLAAGASDTICFPDEPEELFGIPADESKRKELIHICDKNEYMFLKVYTEALKEYLGFNKLRDIMVYQYNSIRAGFVKLRLLHSLRMNEQLSLS